MAASTHLHGLGLRRQAIEQEAEHLEVSAVQEQLLWNELQGGGGRHDLHPGRSH